MEREPPEESGEFEAAPRSSPPPPFTNPWPTQYEPPRLTRGQAVALGLGVVVGGLLLARLLAPTAPPVSTARAA